MNYPAAPMSGIFALLRQATGYPSEIILTPQGAGNLSALYGEKIYLPWKRDPAGTRTYYGFKRETVRCRTERITWTKGASLLDQS